MVGCEGVNIINIFLMNVFIFLIKILVYFGVKVVISNFI